MTQNTGPTCFVFSQYRKTYGKSAYLFTYLLTYSMQQSPS